MTDPTEGIRRLMVDAINSEPTERTRLEGLYGQVWSTEELRKDFDALAFAAPYIVVRRKSDGQKGTLMFQHSPRYYWSFEPDV